MPLLPLPAAFFTALADAWLLQTTAYAVGAAVMVFFIVIGVMLLLDINIDTKVVVGIILLLIGLTIAFYMLGGDDISGILVGLIAALSGKELIEHFGWL